MTISLRGALKHTLLLTTAMAFAPAVQAQTVVADCPSSKHLAQHLGWISGASASSWG
jgi:hypothetical protein